MNHGEHGDHGVESEIDQVNEVNPVNEVPRVQAACPFTLPVGGDEHYLEGPAGEPYAAFDSAEQAEYAAMAINAYAASGGQ
jgi:hypothetical protein